MSDHITIVDKCFMYSPMGIYPYDNLGAINRGSGGNSGSAECPASQD